MTFPRYGKSLGGFSTLWKKCFHAVEKRRAVARTHNTSLDGRGIRVPSKQLLAKDEP